MLTNKEDLSLEQASTIARAALAHARAENMSPMSVAVIDLAGTIRCLLTENGSALMRPDIAVGKAWGCVGLGFSTRDMQGFFESKPELNPAYYAFMGLANHRLVPSPGGVFIIRGESVIGAVGISGDLPDRDEDCAIAGIEAAGLVARI
jgi:uncharacterized protein GlcG (DUF336 family)